MLLVWMLAAQPAASALDGRSDGLWQKAMDVFRRNSDWFPGKVSVVSEILDRKGRPDSVTELFFDIVFDEKNAARTELTRAFRNHKDVSVEMKKNLAGRENQDEKDAEKRDRFTVSLADIPFNPEKQQDVTVSAHAEKRLLFGRNCQRFDFTFRTAIVQKGRKEDLTWVGMAWLDENSGVPVKLEFSFEPLPRNVQRFWMIYLYDVNATPDWTLKEIRAEGQGGFLFIKKGFRSTTVFSDYRRRPRPGDPS
ncbi:MAG TPA: hypothetical protein VLQ89_04035 [Candidatus Binatia bacterium]|nr:hypothetical protein [Candidatus Binatia bacterium]